MKVFGISFSSLTVEYSFMDCEVIDLEVKNPCGIVVSSPSNSGKTHYIVKLLLKSDKLFANPISRVIVVCSHQQDIYKKLCDKFECFFVNTLEDCEPHLIPHAVLLIDDQLSSFENTRASNKLSDYFTRRFHHEQLTVILIVQCLYNKFLKTCFENTTYLIVGKWIKNTHSIQILARQFRPNNSRAVIDCYENATKDAYNF